MYPFSSTLKFKKKSCTDFSNVVYLSELNISEKKIGPINYYYRIDSTPYPDFNAR
jgi:hypothetical protein